MFKAIRFIVSCLTFKDWLKLILGLVLLALIGLSIAQAARYAKSSKEEEASAIIEVIDASN